MDGSFEIYIPQSIDLGSTGFKVPVFQWQGIDYPQGPPELNFGDAFTLRLLLPERFSIYNIPAEMNNIKWQGVEVLGQGLDKYIASVYGFGEEDPAATLNHMLHFLLDDVPHWMLVFSAECDGYNLVKQGVVDDVLAALAGPGRHLHEGFLIYQ